MKVLIDLYSKKVTKLTEEESKEYIDGIECQQSVDGKVWDGEEYLVIEVYS